MLYILQLSNRYIPLLLLLSGGRRWYILIPITRQSTLALSHLLLSIGGLRYTCYVHTRARGRNSRVNWHSRAWAWWFSLGSYVEQNQRHSQLLRELIKTDIETRNQIKTFLIRNSIEIVRIVYCDSFFYVIIIIISIIGLTANNNTKKKKKRNEHQPRRRQSYMIQRWIRKNVFIHLIVLRKHHLNDT